MLDGGPRGSVAADDVVERLGLSPLLTPHHVDRLVMCHCHDPRRGLSARRVELSWPLSTPPGTRSARRPRRGPGHARCAAQASTPRRRTCRTGGRRLRGHPGRRAPGDRDRRDAPRVLPASFSGVDSRAIRERFTGQSPGRGRRPGRERSRSSRPVAGRNRSHAGRAASARFCQPTGALWKPKSRRKSAGKIVRWRTKRSGKPASRAVAVGVRLECGQAAVATLADRRQDQALQRPRALRLDQVGARDDRGVAARRPGGHRVRAGRRPPGRTGRGRSHGRRRGRPSPTARTPPRRRRSSAASRRARGRGGSATTCTRGTGRGVGDGRAGQVVDAGGAHRAATSSTCTETTATSIATIDSR